MIYRNLISLFVFAALAFSSSFSHGNLCQELLTPESREDVKADRIEVLENEMQAIEVMAAIALSLELQPDVTMFRQIKNARNFLYPHYPSVPRIEAKDSGKLGLRDYAFNKIEKNEKALIRKDLYGIMMKLAKASKLGNKFNDRFDKESHPNTLFERAKRSVKAFVTSDNSRVRPATNDIVELLERRADEVKELLKNKDSFRAIVFNAVNLPRLPLKTRMWTAAKKNTRVIGIFALSAGLISEALLPNFAVFWIFDPLLNDLMPQEVMPDLLQNSYDDTPLREYASSILTYAAVGAVVAPGILRNRDGRFDPVPYNFSYGEDVREGLVEDIIADEFPED